MRNVAFVIGSLVLAAVVVAGYQQLRPMGQRVASSGTAPQSGDTTELASRLLLPPYLSQDGATYELRMYAGTLPPDPKIDLPRPAGTRLVGATLRLRNNVPASLDAVMDVPASAGDVPAFFERELTKLGWSQAPNRGGGQSGGFVSAPIGSSKTYCKGEAPPWYSVSVFTPAGAPIAVRAHVDLINPNPFPGGFGPCSQPPGPQPMNGLNKLPPLRAPAGVVMRGSGGGGGNDRQSSEATATSRSAGSTSSVSSPGAPGSSGSRSTPASRSSRSRPSADPTRCRWSRPDAASPGGCGSTGWRA